MGYSQSKLTEIALKSRIYFTSYRKWNGFAKENRLASAGFYYRLERF